MQFMLRKYLSKSELQLIGQKIAEAEKGTLGEIRISIRHKRFWKERKHSVHQIALAEFDRLRMWNTEHRTGVLIMLLVSERKFQIIADEGIHAKVQEGTWDRIATSMTDHFHADMYAQGLLEAVSAVGSELKEHFPSSGPGSNELPDTVVER